MNGAAARSRSIVGDVAVVNLLLAVVVLLALIGSADFYRHVVRPWWFTHSCVADGYEPVARFTHGRQVFDVPPWVAGGATLCVDGDRVVRTYR